MALAFRNWERGTFQQPPGGRYICASHPPVVRQGLSSLVQHKGSSAFPSEIIFASNIRTSAFVPVPRQLRPSFCYKEPFPTTSLTSEYIIQATRWLLSVHLSDKPLVSPNTTQAHLGLFISAFIRNFLSVHYMPSILLDTGNQTC